MAIDIANSEIVALVGSADFSDPVDGQVNGVLARRSPGSTLKPFLYAAAFDARVRPLVERRLADVVAARRKEQARQSAREVPAGRPVVQCVAASGGAMPRAASP